MSEPSDQFSDQSADQPSDSASNLDRTLGALEWQRCEDLFADLADRLGAEQETALERLRPEEPRVVARVERWLAADRDLDEDFLAPRPFSDSESLGKGASSLAELADTTDQESGSTGAPDPSNYSALPGDRLGPFIIERALGRGGMGEVFLARRLVDEGQESFTQVVALKVIRPIAGPINLELRQRFLRERRILARLEHPGIARLVDGGNTPDGRPYLAMELVAGEPITIACSRRKLDLSERLELFLQACRAVQFAHENLIVHRDLKPSNVLVSDPTSSDGTGSPVVKLLDFGIASLLERQDDDEPLTRTGLAPATPDYAAPEQLRGEPVSTATDVFALGVMLFEVLTGRRPPDWPPALGSPGGRTPPSPKSRADSPAPTSQGVAAVPTDLAAIVQRALEEEPARRYRSVADLIADLDRFRADQPVHARQGNRWYRGRKFVARHRLAVGAALALLLVFLAGVAGTVSQARKAERNAIRAQRVVEFLTQIFEANDPSNTRGAQVSALELLDSGAARVARDLSSEPLVKAEIETVLGRLYRSLGSYQRSRELISSASTELRARAPQSTLLAAALVEQAQLDAETGDPAGARALLEEALAIQENSSADDALDAQAGEQTRALLGGVLMSLGEHDEGLALIERAHRERLARGGSALELAHSGSQLADALLEVGDFDRAEDLYRGAITIYQRELTPPDPRLAQAWSDLGVALINRGGPAEALEFLRRALDARRTIYGDQHVEVAHSLRNLSAAERAAGDAAAGNAMLEEALSTYRALFGDQHPDVAETYNNLAVARVQAGDLVGAVAMFEKAVETQRALFGPGHPGLVLPLSSLGNLLTQTGNFEAAELHLLEANRLALTTLDQGHPYRSLVAHNLAGVYLQTGRPLLAEPLLNQALPGFRHALGERHPNVGVTLLSMGKVARAKAVAQSAGTEQRNQQNQIAARHFKEASEILLEAPPQMVDRVVQALAGESEALLDLGQSARALNRLVGAVALLEGNAREAPAGVEPCRVAVLLRASLAALGRAATSAPLATEPERPADEREQVDRFLEWTKTCS